MKKIFLILFLAIGFFGFSQSIKRGSINSGGMSSPNLLMTVGQTAAFSANVSSNNLTIGFQQPVRIPLDTALTIKTDSSICFGDSTVLFVKQAPHINWYRNDTIVGQMDSTRLTVKQSGRYRAVLSDDFGFSDTTREINVIVFEKSLSVLPAGPGAVCSPVNRSVLRLVGHRGNIQWQWSTDSVSFNTLVGQNFDSLLVLNQTSRRFYRAVVKNGVCTSDTGRAFLIRNIDLKPSFTVNKAVQCLDSNRYELKNTSTVNEGTLGYEWSFGDSTYSLAASPAMSYRQSGNYKVVLRALSSFGCSDTTFSLVKVNAPAAKPLVTVTGKTTSCLGDTVRLSSTAFLSYRWFRNDTELRSDTSRVLNPTSSGVYRIRGVSTEGCAGPLSDSIRLVINALPLAPQGKDTVYCLGTVARPLSAVISSGNKGLWYRLPSGDTSRTTPITPVVSSVGKQDYYVSQRSDSTGCESQKFKITVTVSALPSRPTITWGGGVFQANTDTTHVGYQWIVDGKAIPGNNSIIYRPLVGGLYRVRVTNASGCADTSAVFNLVVTSVNNAGSGAASNGLTNMRIYPNPFRGKLLVDAGERPTKEYTIRVFDARGRTITTVLSKRQVTELNTAGMTSGQYMVEISEGTKRKTMRVVKSE